MQLMPPPVFGDPRDGNATSYRPEERPEAEQAHIRQGYGECQQGPQHQRTAAHLLQCVGHDAEKGEPGDNSE